jgi:hypothetical protein
MRLSVARVLEGATAMRLRSTLAALALLAAACGGTGPSDDGVDATDSDGDSIADVHEGAPGDDTDGDGTPDFEDDDSDGDGVPDYREAGDEDATTAPNDSDSDGTPDFRDTDADGNGRRDGDDGVGDVDSDGRPDFADLDDDADNMADTVEMGDASAPTDSDGDGTFDYQDVDSDGDGVRDSYEGPLDYDTDGTPNYQDEDADADCIADELEGGNPPRDADADNRWDFIDRDSDNDGVPDQTEDANCNGVADGGESSATSEDTDGDGVSDLVEVTAGTDATDAASNPQANGDFVFVEPYQAPQTPTEDALDFATDLVKMDVYVLVDRSGSMKGEIDELRANLAGAIDSVQCPPQGVGDTETCVPDLWAGGGTLGYTSDEPYKNRIDIQPNPSFATIPSTTLTTTPTNEATTFALWSAITGQGSATAGCTLSTVAARSSCAGSPAATAGYGTFGYPCFRDGALPVVLLATDEAPRTGGGTTECPAWANTVRNAFAARSAKLVGIVGTVGAGDTTASDLATMATHTGAVDSANNNAPLVFDGHDDAAAEAIADGIRTLADGIPLDLSAQAVDDTAADTVDAVASFVDHLETLQAGTADCAAGLSDQDSNSDGFDDYYVDVRAGTPVCWKVVSKQNTTVPATNEPQLFRATVEVYGDGVTVLDSRDVYFLVPPASFDPPID